MGFFISTDYFFLFPIIIRMSVTTMNTTKAPIVISLRADIFVSVSGDINKNTTPKTSKITIKLIKVPSFIAFPPLFIFPKPQSLVN